MRIAAICLNVLLLFIALYLIAEDIRHFSVAVCLVASVFVITPPFTIFTLAFRGSECWLSLYFRRKAAEEGRRIAEIEAGKH